MKILNRHGEQKFIFNLTVLLAVHFAVKFLSPWIIQYLFQENKFDILNLPFSSSDHQSLNYYLGQWERLIYGPVTVLLSTVIFLIIASKYLVNSTTKQFTLAVFLFLLITKFEVLLFPPYGDTASGPFMEAVWLAKHQFNYLALSREKIFIDGGPKVYLFSIYPTYIALLLKLIPYTKLFIAVNHVLVFLMGSVIIGYLRKIFLSKFDGKIALLLSLLMMFLPLFQSQIEAINMEIPMVMFAILAFYHLIRKNFWWALLFAVLSAAVKGVAIFVCMTVFFSAILCFFFDSKKRFKFSLLLCGIIACLYTAGLLYAAFFILNNNADSNKVFVSRFIGISWMKKSSLTYIYLFTSAVCFIQIITSLFKKDKMGGVFNKIYPFMLSFICTTGWFVVFVNSYGGQIRYKFLLLPFLIIFLSFISEKILQKVKLAQWLMIALLLLSSTCSYGFFQYPREVFDDAQLERSLEYRNDLHLDMLLAKHFQEKYPNYLISAPFTTAQILYFPELGYVQQQMNVMIYQYPITYGIKNFKGLAGLNLYQTIWVWIKVEMPEHMKIYPEYPIGPFDQVVEIVEYGRRQATLFKGGISIEKMRRITEDVLKQNVIEAELNALGLSIDDINPEEVPERYKQYFNR